MSELGPLISNDARDIKSPSLNADTAGPRQHFARQRILTIIIALVALHGISTYVWFVPSCPNGEATVCGSGQSGQVNPSNAVSFTSCTSGSTQLTAIELLGIPQAGHITNGPPVAQCSLYGCAANQCLKETSSCSSTAKSYACVDAQNIVDMQPAPLAVCLILLLVSLFMLVTRRPYDLSNARVAGMLVVMFGLYQLAINIKVYRSCPWRETTYGACTGSVAHLEEIVTLDTCFVQELWFFSPLASNLMVPTSNDCLLYGCNAKQCLQVASKCTGDKTTQNTCVPQQAYTDAQPATLLASIAIVLFGLLLAVRSFRYHMGWRRVFSVLVLVYCVHAIGSGIGFEAGCDYDEVTATTCGTGLDGQVKNSNIVSLQACGVNPLLLFPASPFANNLLPLPGLEQCLKNGCGTHQCLKTTQTCTDGKAGDASYTCVPQSAVSVGAPVYLALHVLLAFVAACVLASAKLGGGNNAICSWRDSEPRRRSRQLPR